MPPMPPRQEFEYDVFLSHSAKDKALVRPLAERLRADGLKVWFDEWVLKAGDCIPANSDLPSLRRSGETWEGLEPSNFGFRTSDFGFAQPGMSANAFGSDWAQLEAGTCGRGTLPFRDPLNQERRFIPPAARRSLMLATNDEAGCHGEPREAKNDLIAASKTEDA